MKSPTSIQVSRRGRRCARKCHKGGNKRVIQRKKGKIRTWEPGLNWPTKETLGVKSIETKGEEEEKSANQETAKCSTREERGKRKGTGPYTLLKLGKKLKSRAKKS